MPVLNATTPIALQLHLLSSVAALVLGPAALAARKGSPAHRTAGLLWCLLMLTAAASSLFIRDFRLPNWAGYTPIHLFTLITFAGVLAGLLALARGDLRTHGAAMRRVYLGGCVGAGVFALLPGRLLGQWLWGQCLGWL